MFVQIYTTMRGTDELLTLLDIPRRVLPGGASVALRLLETLRRTLSRGDPLAGCAAHKKNQHGGVVRQNCTQKRDGRKIYSAPVVSC